MTHDGSGGVTPSLSARDLVDAVPGLADIGVGIDVITFRGRPGASLTAEDLTELSETTAPALRPSFRRTAAHWDMSSRDGYAS
jgi:L-asparaginase